MIAFKELEYAGLIIPLVFAFLGLLTKGFAIFRKKTNSWTEIRNHIYLLGIELCVLAISLYFIEGYITTTFLGYVIFDNIPDYVKVFYSCLFYSVLFIIMLLLAIASFRMSHRNCFIYDSMEGNRIYKYLSSIFIITSIFIGMISFHVLILIVH